MIRETKPIYFCIFWDDIFKLKLNTTYAKSTMQSLTMFYFSLLKILKNLLCIYNAWYLSRLDTYKLYKSHKLQQTDLQNQQTTTKRNARNPSLGANNDKKLLQTYKGKWQPATVRRQTGKSKAQDPDHWSGLRHFNPQPK